MTTRTSEFMEQFFERMPDPDNVGEAEYRLVHELLEAVAETGLIDGAGTYDGDVSEALLGAIQQLEESVAVAYKNWALTRGCDEPTAARFSTDAEFRSLLLADMGSRPS